MMQANPITAITRIRDRIQAQIAGWRARRRAQAYENGFFWAIREYESGRDVDEIERIADCPIGGFGPFDYGAMSAIAQIRAENWRA